MYQRFTRASDSHLGEVWRESSPGDQERPQSSSSLRVLALTAAISIAVCAPLAATSKAALRRHPGKAKPRDFIGDFSHASSGHNFPVDSQSTGDQPSTGRGPQEAEWPAVVENSSVLAPARATSYRAAALKVDLSIAGRAKLVTVNTFANASYDMLGVPGQVFENLGAGMEWEGFYTKVINFLPYLRKQAECDPEQLLILADGTDIVYGGCGEDLLLHRYRLLVNASDGARVVCGADSEIFPRSIGAASRFDFLNGRRDRINRAFGLPYNPFQGFYIWEQYDYNFVNSGFLMGPVSALLTVMECMASHGNSSGIYDDQEALTECMLRHPKKITIDYSGQLIQTVKGLRNDVVYGAAGRIHSAVSKAPQCFVHFNQDPFPKDYVEEMLGNDQSSRCTFLLSASVSHMVQTGFGARVDELYFSLLRAFQHGCNIVVSQPIAAQWVGLKLGRFWDVAVSEKEFSWRWEAAPPCSNLRLKSVPDFVRCQRMPDLGWFVPMPCNDIARLKGSDPLLSIFSSSMAAYNKPYGNQSYTGLHIRLGDKDQESKVFDLQAMMHQERGLWPTSRDMFIASAEPNLTADPAAIALYDLNYTFRSSLAVEQQDSSFNHRSDDAAVAAVLDDLAGLAHAASLVGNAASNFFMLAHILNRRLHALVRAAPRASPWCYDMATGSLCDTGKSQTSIACQGTDECWCGKLADTDLPSRFRFA